MMKRYLSILFIVTIMVNLFSCTFVFASDKIRIEAEDFVSASFKAKKAAPFPDLSGKGIMTFQAEYEDGMIYKLTYNLKVDQAGLYSMTAASTKLGFGYTADYKVQVNDDEPFSAKQATMKSEYNTSFSSGIMGIYDIGTVKLNKGDNKLFIIVDKKNDSNTQVTLHIDYFEFSKAPWGVRSFSPIAPVGVFEDGKPVKIEVEYVGTPADKELRFEVRDFWNSVLLDGNMLVKKGAQKDVLNLGVLPKGWYKISLYDGDTQMIYTSVSVVPQMSKRTDKETPFAVDYASAWLAPADKWDEYAKALKLGGINWARERFAWGETNPEPNKVDYAQYKKSAQVFEKEGIHILDTYHDSPQWTRTSGNRMLPEDLFETYKFNQRIAKDMSEVDFWEMWNEQDVQILFLTETADAYAAHMKAAAIALAETEKNPYVGFGGYSQNANETDFIDLVMQNGIMEYSNTFNYHNHTVYENVNAKNAIDMNFKQGLTQIETARAYDKDSKPIWVTEAGMRIYVEPGAIAPKQDLLNTQARYLITSNVQSISMGNNKNFWFVFPKYIENGGDFGTFYEFHTPYPAYQAKAVMTYVLGEGKYKGTVNNLSEGTRGFVIDSGKSDVAVFWADSDNNVILHTQQPVFLTDMMGGEKTLLPTNGEITVKVGIDPLFITFNGRMNQDDYTLTPLKETKLEKNKFTDTQKIVLNQTYEDINFYEGKQYGYRKPMDKPFQMSVEVYNFADKEMKGEIKGTCEADVTFTPNVQEVTVAPMSKKTVTFDISAGKTAKYDLLYDLMFTGTFNGEVTSPTVSHISFKRDAPPMGVLIPGSDKGESWDETNGAVGIDSYVIDGDNKGEVKIGANMTQPGSWYYPYLPVDGKTLKGYDGISFWIKGDKNVSYKEPEFIDAFLYGDDGSKYYVGLKPIAFQDDWQYFYIAWDNWIQYNGGTRGDKVINPESIINMSIGFNTTRTTEITVKNVEAFKFPQPLEKPLQEISFNRVKDGDNMSKLEAKDITATLPEGIDVHKTRVIVNNIEHTGKIEGKQIHIDMSEFEAGSYVLTVVAYTSTGYAIDQNVRFTVY